MKIDIHTHYAGCSDSTMSIRSLMPADATDAAPHCSIGLHPWHIGEDWMAAMEEVCRKTTESNVLMIGECGLDKLHKSASWELQQEVFLRHIEISESVGKPLIIHCVKAFDEIIVAKKKMHPSQPWIIHGFRGKPQQAQQLLDNGFHLSFGERFNNASLMLAYESNRLWFETDENILDITQIYSLASTVLNVPTSVLEERIEDNAAALLGIHAQAMRLVPTNKK